VDPKEAEIVLKGKIVVGTFINEDRPDFMQTYKTLVVAKAQAGKKGKAA